MNRKKYGNTRKRLLALLVSASLALGTAVPALASDFAADFGSGEETAYDVSFSGSAVSAGEVTAVPDGSGITAEPIEAAGGAEMSGSAVETPVGELAENVVTEDGYFTEDTDFTSENTGDSENDPDIRYIKGRPLTEEEIAGQRSMEKIGESMQAPQEADSALYSNARAFAANLPEKYDLRQSGWITSVKDQGRGLGICWAFSLASLMETSLLKQNLGSYDLSEEHLAYFLYNHVDDPLGNTPKDRTINVDGYHEGGNGLMGVTHLSTWAGMTTEADVPMPDSLSDILPDTSKAYHAVAYLKNANVSGYGVTRTKNLITSYSSVGTLLYYSPGYMSWDTAAYACPKGYDPTGNDKTINHMVTLVGWDDTYSYKNFSSNSGITTNGAWIAKNSWGDQWGDNGYFYISYQDASLSGMVTVEAMVTTDYPNNYFYDGTALNKYISLNSGESVANVFTVKAADGKAEVLGEVSVFTYNDNTKYTVKIYTNLKDSSSPTSGTLAATVNCQQSYAGIRTLKVPEVTLLPGTSYAVVVTNTNSGALKLAAECDQNASWVSTMADVRYGQSFYSAADLSNWKDWADPVTYRMKDLTTGICMRLKAHTKNTELVPALSLSDTAMILEIGKTAALTATVTPSSPGGNYSAFSSSDPEIVKVEKADDHTARLTAVRPGTATITCRSALIPGLVQTCSVTVVFTPPTNLKASSARYDQVGLTWTAAPGTTVTGYQIYRLSSGESAKRVATVSASKTTYTDKSLLTGTSYSYRIRAYVKFSSGDVAYSAFTAYQSAVPVMATVSCTAKADSSYNTVTWKKIAGADGYFVYRRISGQSWKRIKTIKNSAAVTYKDKGTKALTSYEYAVRAYRKVSGQNVKSAFKPSGTVIAAPVSQKIKSASNVSGGVKLKWTAQKNASGYRIYRKLPKGSWVLLKDLSGGSKNTYTDTTITKNTTCYYAVRAYINEPYGGKAMGPYTAKKVTVK